MTTLNEKYQHLKKILQQRQIKLWIAEQEATIDSAYLDLLMRTKVISKEDMVKFRKSFPMQSKEDFRKLMQTSGKPNYKKFRNEASK